MKVTDLDYTKLLSPWFQAAKKYLYVPNDRPDLECYGTGYNSWGVQTNQKAFAALAVLASDSEQNEHESGIQRKEILEHAQKLLRFSLESHIEGSYKCTDNTSWGHTWISTLGIERMMHGVEAIKDTLTESDHKLLERVLVSECDWLLDEYKIGASLLASEGKNRPESNMWNGALLHRVAVMYPDCARKPEYLEKGTSFLLNAISIPSDAESGQMFDNKALVAFVLRDLKKRPTCNK